MYRIADECMPLETEEDPFPQFTLWVAGVIEIQPDPWEK